MLDRSYVYIFTKNLLFFCFNTNKKEMANICPLLIRASFIGRTYHDFQLKFQSPTTNCTPDPDQDPLLIQFTRILNSTLNHTTYALYDPTEPNEELPHLQVFHNDHVNLCIRSAIDTDKNDITCHEFYMITMLSSVNTSIWPLLIIFGYMLILLIAILLSSLSTFISKFSKTLFSGSITKKIIKNQNIRSFIPVIHRQTQKTRLDEKEEVLRAIRSIAKECQLNPNPNAFIIQTDNENGHINRGYF
jgi:hypothetical protein